MAAAAFELPQINYAEHNGRRYRYAYDVGIHVSENPSGWLDQIVKLVESRSPSFWHEDGVFPGEPVFVKNPSGEREDDGVLLSIVLNPQAGNSFLLVLDARDLNEIARAPTSQHVPFHFHGHFSSAAV